MPKRIDITGQTFGYLKVIEISEIRDNTNCRLWKCLCTACGRTCYISGGRLRNLERTSCGCRGKTREPKSKVYEPKTDCIMWREKTKDCDALVMPLCVTKGKCKFYKSTVENDS